MNNTFKKILGQIARYGLVLLAFSPLVRLVSQRWPEVQAALWNTDLLEFIGSTCWLMLILPAAALIPWASLRFLGINFSFRKAFSIYFITQLPKYLPGGFWALPGRVLAYQLAQVGRAEAVISLVREVAALFIGAVLVGGVLLFQGIVIEPAFQIAVVLGVLACVVLTVLMQAPFFWKIVSRVFKNAGPTLLAADGRTQIGRFSWIPAVLGCSLLFWLAMGIPFRLLCIAVNADLAHLSVLQAASLYALSWSIGFAFVFVPAGFGVRESALSILLLKVASPADAVTIALLARLWSTAVEACCVAISIRLISTQNWLPGFRWRKLAFDPPSPGTEN